jgi:hypothetical protein
MTEVCSGPPHLLCDLNCCVVVELRAVEAKSSAVTAEPRCINGEARTQVRLKVAMLKVSMYIAGAAV